MVGRDRSLKPGETWPQVIERELNDARCVVVPWSERAVASPWVRVEANRARERRNVVPVRLDATDVPPEYATYQAFDMSGDSAAGAFEKLGESVAQHVRRNVTRRRWFAGGAALLEAFIDDVRRSLRRAAIGKVSSRAETRDPIGYFHRRPRQALARSLSRGVVDRRHAGSPFRVRPQHVVRGTS